MDELPSIDFYFDVSSFQAFVASKVVLKWQRDGLANINWIPIDLSEIRRLSESPIPDGRSEFSILTPPKKAWTLRNLVWMAAKHGVHFTRLPDTSAYIPASQAMAVLLKLKKHNSSGDIATEASSLFDAMWDSQSAIDVNDPSLLSRILNPKDSDGYSEMRNYHPSSQCESNLLKASEIACKEHRVFDVPTVLLNGREMFVGLERLDMVENVLLNHQYHLHLNQQQSTQKNKSSAVNVSSKDPTVLHARLPRSFSISPQSSDILRQSNKVEVFVDFASPWAFLGYCRLRELYAYAKVRITPVLIGAIFRSTGGPMLPAAAVSSMQRQYGSIDLPRLVDSAGVKFHFNKHFPLRSVTALRVALIEPLTLDCLFRASWQNNRNISNDKELINILDAYGFNGSSLVKQAKSDRSVKNKLSENTQRALDYGIFGLPSYIVNGQSHNFVWGQDRLDFVKAMCLGWNPPVMKDYHNGTIVDSSHSSLSKL